MINSQSTDLMREEMAASEASRVARTFEDDDEDIARAILPISGSAEQNDTEGSNVDQIEAGASSIRRVAQPFSEQHQQVLRVSALGESETEARAETPLATSEVRNEERDSSATRAFSKSSYRRAARTVGIQEAEC